MIDKIDKKLIKKYTLKIGQVYFYENFFVAEINEGITLNFEKSAILFELAQMHYTDKTPFVCISNRKNSYSFEPTSHFKSEKLFPNLKGFAAVIYDDISKEVASLEQAFINKIPSRIFYSLKDAIDWVDELIVSH
ncbi:STAS/SEC14 domain-containing protein [Aquimarina sp. AD10]|uniref:STAS/SEC14 domain-containing protein n=1 Tax=Aquimarina aggregata TaxID=1642818 RepID=A0A163A8E2_9FLAO|nr:MULTISPECIES: hypothetical protein [Aquimarina]AXT63327.1 STAS/SEC14 domain-containing protein [Aquimarina sp. AD10]KZS40341.1 hypothetical protein AWE51_05135 [Aquimarina aggregata]RKN00660.1 STAS/SEC14 domain-containing protein [Aquimarina sp. AD10]